MIKRAFCWTYVGSGVVHGWGRQLESLTHTHMDFDTKEQLKAMLGFSKVPYCVMASAVSATHAIAPEAGCR